MDVTITGRNTEIPDRFREYAEEKVTAKVEQLSDKVLAVEVKLTRRTDRAGNVLDKGKVEITLFGRGPVIRAEAEAGDKYAAFDIALDKLAERLRRAKDRRTARRGEDLHGASTKHFEGYGVVPADTSAIDVVSGRATATATADGEEDDLEEIYTPVVIREKVFEPKRMTSDEAVDHMELLGHDFFLFLERESGRPSVVYRRRGWDYGVIALGDEA